MTAHDYLQHKFNYQTSGFHSNRRTLTIQK